MDPDFLDELEQTPDEELGAKIIGHVLGRMWAEQIRGDGPMLRLRAALAARRMGPEAALRAVSVLRRSLEMNSGGANELQRGNPQEAPGNPEETERPAQEGQQQA